MPQIPVYENKSLLSVPVVQPVPVSRPLGPMPSKRGQSLQEASSATQILGHVANLLGGGQRASAVQNRAALDASSATQGEQETPLSAALDEEAAQIWNQQFATVPDQPAAQCFADDYAILRRQAAKQEQQSLRQKNLGTWQQESRRSLQTAALIGQAPAFKEYISKRKEYVALGASALGLDGDFAAKDFEQKAISLSLQNALSAQDVSAAQDMLAQFAAGLPAKEHPLWEEKIASARAQRQGFAAFVSAQKEGGLTPEQLQARVLKTLAGAPEKDRKQAAFYATLFTRQKEQQQATIQARHYQALCDAQDLPYTQQVLSRFSAQDPAHYTRVTQAALQRWANPQQATDPAHFNRLYSGVESGKTTRAELDKALDGAQLNGRDYLFLCRQASARSAGEEAAESAFVRVAAERFCRKQEVPAAQEQAFTYRVLSTPGGASEQLKTLQRLKKCWAD